MATFGMGGLLGLGGPGLINPVSLSLSGLLLSSFSSPPPWVGTASAGTSSGHNFTSALVDPPSGKALTSFQRSAVTAPDPWPGTSSTGNSGSRNWFNPGGLEPPSAGATLNGYATRFYDQTLSQFDQASVTLGNLITNSASSGWMLLKINSFQYDNVDPSLNDPILMDSGAYYGLTLSQTARTGGAAVTFFILSGGFIIGADCTIDSGAIYQLVQWRHTGTTMEIRVISPSSGPTPWQIYSGDPISGKPVGNVDVGFSGQTFYAATNNSLSKYGDYTWVDGGLIDSALSYTEMDSIALDVQNYYNLAFLIYGAPSTGASLNGYTSADFGGATNRIALKYSDGPNTSIKNLSDLVGDGSANSFYIRIMFKARTAPADGGNLARYGNAHLFGDEGGNLFITFSTAGVSAGMYDTTTGFDDVTLACSTGAWHWAQIWHNGITLWLQIDNGTPSSLLSNSGAGVNLPSTWFRTYVTGLVCYMGGGGNSGGSGYFDGQIHVLETAVTIPTRSQRIGTGLYYQKRYGVKFGF